MIHAFNPVGIWRPFGPSSMGVVQGDGRIVHLKGQVALADIASLTHYVTDIDEFMRTREIRREFFSEPFPATTTVQVVRLYDRDLLVEISAVAEIPRARFRPPFAPPGAGEA